MGMVAVIGEPVPLPIMAVPDPVNEPVAVESWTRNSSPAGKLEGEKETLKFAPAQIEKGRGDIVGTEMLGVCAIAEI